MLIRRFAMAAAAILFALAWFIPNATAGQNRTLSFTGLAAYYSHGGRVAAGGRFNPSGFSAAHRTLPFGTQVRITDPRSGRSVIVTINDRGPYGRGRVIDVSIGAARALGMIGRGIIYVRADVL